MDHDCGNAGLLVYDPSAKVAYVADRIGNRIAVVNVGDTLELASTIKTPAEPYGVALSPDRKTVIVTTIADRALVAYETATENQTTSEPGRPDPTASRSAAR